MSLLGLAWAGFGVGIVFRFFMLAYDAAAFSSPSTSLADRPPAVVNLALASAGLFWLCFVAAAVAARLLPVPRLLYTLVRRPGNLAHSSLLATTAVFERLRRRRTPSIDTRLLAHAAVHHRIDVGDPGHVRLDPLVSGRACSLAGGDCHDGSLVY